MKISFDISNDLLDDAIREAVADYDLDSIAADAVRDAVENYDLDDIAADAMQSRIRDFDENDILTEMVNQMTAREYARGITAGKLAVKPIRPNYEELAARIDEIALWCGIGGSVTADIERVLPLAGDDPAEVINAARSATGGTLGGGFVAGMLYCIKEMKSREVDI